MTLGDQIPVGCLVRRQGTDLVASMIRLHPGDLVDDPAVATVNLHALKGGASQSPYGR